MDSIKYGRGNSKMNHVAVEQGLPKAHVLVFSLPAGRSCPCADKCKAWAGLDPTTGHYKLEVGPANEFVCYAARREAQFRTIRECRMHNFMALLRAKTEEGMAALLLAALPKIGRVKIVRIHDSGDFFNMTYYRAWVLVARTRQDIAFFGYTKMLDAVLDDTRPDNFRLAYSYGGTEDRRRDSLADEGISIPTCYVVKSIEHADKSMPVACVGQNSASQDMELIWSGRSFQLLEH